MASARSETDVGGDEGRFQPTFWTIVLKAKDLDSPERREALERLIEAYWKPLYFFVRRRGHDVEAAKDLTQGFFAAFLERDFLQYVEREKGKFRTFLRTALEHYLSDQYDRDRALKRGGGRRSLSLDFQQAETEISWEPASPEETPDQLLRRRWAWRVLHLALNALRAEYEKSGRLDEFEALRLHLSGSAAEAPSYADVARTLGLTETDIKNRLHAARKRYREAILREIRSYTDSDDDAREELEELFAVFAAKT